MFAPPVRLRAVSPSADAELARPRLELSAAALDAALGALVEGCEPLGGAERYVDALKAKAALFAEAFAGGAENLTRDAFLQLCAFMPTVRRRIAPYVGETGFAAMRRGLARLIDGDALASDERIAAFCALYPRDREHRFVRDLAAEVLHNFYPAIYPLMTRWVWDAKAGAGVLRELWHGEEGDHVEIAIPDSYATFLMLREELSRYLSANGVCRDVMYFVDLLCAQVYADYICSQGGAYLRTDFAAPDDPIQHTCRMLGLDGVRPGANRTRLKTIDGEAFVIDDAKLLS